ncbi:unnamed protein product [Rhizoctonia solani]|uniref:C2H2-type domain-containing protein n=1 Tax=Rhizoctonia solani TaxID=456999 RepID=A0A8H3D2I9_9AGAM|nr:unnamed protein product [Rhizoctonia solani]
MSWVQPNTASSLPPPSHYAANTPDILATDHFDPRRAWATQTTLAACSPMQGVAVMGNVGVPRQLPYPILPSGPETSHKVQETSPSPVDSIHGLQGNAITAFTGQINLATNPNSGDSIGHGTTQYEYPPGFNSSFGQTIYHHHHQYADNSIMTQIGDADAQTPQAFSYGYTESHAPIQPSDGVAQNSQRFEYNDFQPASGGPYLDTQPLNELYPGARHTNTLHAEYPYHSAGEFVGKPSEDVTEMAKPMWLVEQRASAMSLQKSEVQPSFIISFDGTPLAMTDDDAWSSAAFSPPSLASFHSSPPSTRHDSSALGTPAQGFEDTPVSHTEPLLNHPLSYSISDLRHLSISPAGRDSSPQRSCRAVSQQGLCVVPSQAGPSGRPFLDDTIAHHIYAESFDPEDVSDCSQGPPTSERGSTPATSPSTSTGFDYPQATGVSTGFYRPSTRGNTARTTTPKSDSSHVVPLIRQLSSKSADGPGQSGGPRHHPYGRSSKISAHEQVIQFDTPTSNVSTASVSDHTEADSRKSKKKSKGSKRVKCEYMCPLKREPCGQSVSREADMSRHMQRHRRAEEAMVREGLLLPELQTNFESLKADEITLCKRCGETLSRKDALRRHLKNAGKACRSFYPEIIIAD